MYLEFFGLKEKPFSLTPDPHFFFESETHKIALEQALYAIHQSEGFIVITGAIGTGKTTLCRVLHERIDRKAYTAVILNPFLSEEELMETVLQEFGIMEKGAQRPSRKEMLDRLNEFLMGTHKAGYGALLIIDEAQNLPMPTLEQIRILSNLETDKEKLLQIILLGQMGLLRLLKSQELQQLDQRVSVRCQINPLKKDEVLRYIEYRLMVAGSSGRISFRPEAVGLIYEYSLGIPRVINLISDRALLAAYSVQTSRIDKKLVQKAIEDLKLERPEGTKKEIAALTPKVGPAQGPAKIRLPFIVGGIVVIAGALGFLIFDNIRTKGVRTDTERRYRQETRSWQLEKSRLDGEVKDLREKIKTLPAGPPMSSPVAVPEDLKESFTILLGTFKSRNIALEKGAALKGLGYKAYVIGLGGNPPEGQYRLALGSFKEKEEAENVLAKLNDRSELAEARVTAFSDALKVD